VFLLDATCLGIKDAFARFALRAEYEENVYERFRQFEYEELPPSCTRKLLEQAVEFAGRFGLAPHPDYRAAQQIFWRLGLQQLPAQQYIRRK
jgi:hypothetical protein